MPAYSQVLTFASMQAVSRDVEGGCRLYVAGCYRCGGLFMTVSIQAQPAARIYSATRDLRRFALYISHLWVDGLLSQRAYS